MYRVAVSDLLDDLEASNYLEASNFLEASELISSTSVAPQQSQCIGAGVKLPHCTPCTPGRFQTRGFKLSSLGSPTSVNLRNFYSRSRTR